ETVAHFPRAGQSKFWRNYSGLMPSDEMISALKNISNESQVEKINVGIQSAKDEYLKLLEKLENNNDFEGILHLRKTLGGIYTNMTGHTLKTTDLSTDNLLNKVFADIGSFVQKNCKDAQKVAKILSLQKEIDDCIKQKKDPNTESIQQKY